MKSNDGYAEEADDLFVRYESIRFEDVHRDVLHLMPGAPARVLDIGAGTGRDAAAFAAMGHDVVAVEPTAALRTRAATLHPSERITWVDDHLPDLVQLGHRTGLFDLVMLTAVWMHLDEAGRERAMPRVASLIKQGGTMVLLLRYGPVRPGRRMFAVSTAETVERAHAAGLRLELRIENQPSRMGQAGVTWSRLAFRKP